MNRLAAVSIIILTLQGCDVRQNGTSTNSDGFPEPVLPTREGLERLKENGLFIQVNADSLVYEGQARTPKQIIEALRALPDLKTREVVLKADPNIKVRVMTSLQSELCEALPELNQPTILVEPQHANGRSERQDSMQHRVTE